MITVIEDAFRTLHFHEEQRLFEDVWSSNSYNMTQEIFKQATAQHYEARAQYEPSLMLSDTRAYVFAITPELQEWLAEEVKKHEANIPPLRKIAILVPEDFITQLSLEQSSEEMNIDRRTKYFTDREEALQWLLT